MHTRPPHGSYAATDATDPTRLATNVLRVYQTPTRIQPLTHCVLYVQYFYNYLNLDTVDTYVLSSFLPSSLSSSISHHAF